MDVRQDREASALYFRMKDARSVARDAERRADTDPENAVQPPEWRQMIGLATEILTTHSKDLEVAAWLVEAALLTARLDGLCGDAAPPSSTIAGTLAEAQDALREVSGISVDLLTGEPPRGTAWGAALLVCRQRVGIHRAPGRPLGL